MKKPPPDLGPAFATVKCQSHPSPKVHDIGVEMRWGTPRHTNRIYWAALANAPYNHRPRYRFEDALVHEDDVPDNVEYQAHLARKTPVGLFIPLTAHLAGLYDFQLVNRDILVVLTEADAVLPTYLAVKAGHQAQFEPAVEPPTGMLSADLEIAGFRLTDLVQNEDRVMLNISWQPLPGGRRFYFVGVIEMRLTAEGITAKWMLPGPCGVNRMLREQFDQRCNGLKACLTAEGRKHCLAGIKPGPVKPAKHVDAWQVNSPQSITVAKSSSTASRPKNERS